ncbi:MAG: hypothetical protein ACXADY_20315 [Candidatus Hodarchaeales archaeon]|jgi:hypothetical protein
MKRKGFSIFMTLLLLFFIYFHLNPGMAVNQDSGTFNGFDWEYGEKTRKFTKSVSYLNSFTESESRTETRNFTQMAPIRTGLQVKDIFWTRLTNRSKIAPKSTWERPRSPQNWRGYRADGYLTNGSGQGGAWFRYEGITVRNWGSGIFGQAANYSWFGRRIDVGLAEIKLFPSWKTSYAQLTIESTETVPMKDWLGITHDSMSVNSYHIEYFDNKNTPSNFGDDELIFEEILIPRFALVRVQTTLMQVSVSETATVSSSLSGQFNFSGTWEENLHGQHVSVKDGSNYWFSYFALISGNVVYSYEGGFSLAGSLSTNITRNVKFSNGTDVNESIRPAGLQSLRISLSGDWDHYHNETGTLYGQGAIQSMIQVLLTKASTNQSPNLAVWGNFNPGRIIGYKDVDGDEILTAYLNESQIETPDALMAVGFPEGAHLEGNHYANGVVDADVYTSLGDWVIIDKHSSITRTIDRPINVTWGYDPRVAGSGPSDVSLTWTNPTESDGKAIFEWETAYNDMPMTWWAKNDSMERIVTDGTKITYGYTLTIDPVLGKALLESTYKQSEIQNAELKEMMSSQEMSMASYRRDYYLSMTQISADDSGSFARPESQFDMTVAGEDLFSQNFGGSKEKYYLNNDPSTTYNSGTSVMNLLTAEGFSGEPTNKTNRNPYSSPISKRIAVALTQWSADTHTEDLSWIFRENLVITSYPTWNGSGITHDPSYAAFYIGKDASGSLETSGPPISTSEDGVPGFGFTISLVLLSAITLLIKKRKRR